MILIQFEWFNHFLRFHNDSPSTIFEWLFNWNWILWCWWLMSIVQSALMEPRVCLFRRHICLIWLLIFFFIYLFGNNDQNAADLANWSAFSFSWFHWQPRSFITGNCRVCFVCVCVCVRVCLCLCVSVSVSHRHRHAATGALNFDNKDCYFLIIFSGVSGASPCEHFRRVEK